MDDFELELIHDFLNESDDLLDAAEDAFLKLEDERNNPDLLNEIFRLAHNLKGTSKAVGLDQLSELTHVAENLILKLKEGEIEVGDDVVSVLLKFKDKIKDMIDGLKDDIEAKFDISSIQNELAVITDNNGKNPQSSQSDNDPTSEEQTVAAEEKQEIEDENDSETLQVFDSIDDIESLEGQDGISQAALEALREISGNQTSPEPKEDSGLKFNNFNDEDKKERPQIKEVPTASDEGSSASSASSKKNAESDESIRVKLSRIDLINNTIGELVILQTVLSQRRYEYIEDDLSNKSISMMGKLFKEVQEIAMSLRMLPLKGIFQKMNRIVRDTSKTLGKQVNLKMSGEDTEIDKTVYEKLSDPLVHIIRNAIDHGLETPQERENIGKTARGNVTIEAYHEGSNLVIQVKDDGKGINPDIIRKKAIEKRVINENSRMSDEEVIQLIFHPGFSTKEQVTEVSGRGVGMDVVKTNIEGLGGEIRLSSEVGKGSVFKIVLPLTLAIIEGVVITSHQDKYVVPLSQIHQIYQVNKEDIDEFSGVAKLFTLRGEVLPLFFINEKLGKKTDDSDYYTVIIVRGLSHSFGVAVDDILNQQQAVIKNLGADIKGKKGIMGAAIMGDGMPALIVDLFELFNEDFKSSRGYQNFKSKVA